MKMRRQRAGINSFRGDGWISYIRYGYMDIDIIYIWIYGYGYIHDGNLVLSKNGLLGGCMSNFDEHRKSNKVFQYRQMSMHGCPLLVGVFHRIQNILSFLALLCPTER